MRRAISNNSSRKPHTSIKTTTGGDCLSSPGCTTKVSSAPLAVWMSTRRSFNVSTPVQPSLNGLAAPEGADRFESTIRFPELGIAVYNAYPILYNCSQLIGGEAAIHRYVATLD